MRGCRQAAHPAFIMAAERLPRGNNPLEAKAVDQLTLCPFTDKGDSYSTDKLARLWGAQGVQLASLKGGRRACLWEPGPSQSCLSLMQVSGPDQILVPQPQPGIKMGLDGMMGSLELLLRAGIQT